MNKKVENSLFGFLVFCVILGALLKALLPKGGSEKSDLLELSESSPWYGNEEIRIFREYLHIPSVHPDIDYEPCVKFLKNQAMSLDLGVAVYYPVNDKNPVVVMTWLGTEPNLPSIMLNSHMDVVPVFEESWSHPPFAADVDEEGKIFARGSQDAKSTGMIHLAAIRALKRDGIKQMRRTFYITFVPDEELGGLLGMAGFVSSDEFKAMNVGYALDEGGVGQDKHVRVYNDERCMWRMEFICNGVTGHGSILFNNTSSEKISYLINKFMEYRRCEVEKLNSFNFPYGNVTSINLTVLKGGVQANVIPPELSVVFDVRLAVDADHDAFERQINQWCEEAGGDITINYTLKDPKTAMTRADGTNPVFVAIEKTTKEFNLELSSDVPRGASDMRYLRRLNISAFGLSPLINTPIRFHDHNEYVQADVYLAGIKFFKKLIFNLGEI